MMAEDEEALLPGFGVLNQPETQRIPLRLKLTRRLPISSMRLLPLLAPLISTPK